MADATTETVDPPQAVIAELTGLYHRRDFAALAERAQAVAIQFDNSVFAHNILGAANAALKRFGPAEQGFRRAAALAPAVVEAHVNLGNVLQAQGKLDEAGAAYGAALALRPDFARGHANLGVILKDLGRTAEAEAAYRRALALDPGHAPTHYNLANLLREKGDLDGAVAAYGRALAIEPRYLAAHLNLGMTLQAQDRTDAALSAFERALALQPDNAETHFNIGNALKAQGRRGGATAAYARALAIRPSHAAALANLGATLHEQGDAAGAAEACRRALALDPANAGGHYNLGLVLQELGALDEALAATERALAIDPSNDYAQAQRLSLKAAMCDWSGRGELAAALETLGLSRPAAPFSLLTLDDDPARNRARAEIFVRSNFKSTPAPFPPPAARPAKLKIGYVSADFHAHATLFLMAGLFRAHDRGRFEIHAYSYGSAPGGEARRRLIGDVDSFIDIRDLSDQAVADLARRQGLDIALDLKGYTRGSRSGLFAGRLAPIQMAYLGYPGTMGADFIDYIVADREVIPPEQRAHYAEHVICLPHSYQANDDRREIAPHARDRAHWALPEDAFVFCCFNNSYKITPAAFDVWMRLLAQVPGAVLWLLRSNPWAEANLREAAAARGVDPTRLVFADIRPAAEHLARQRHADLFLDTFACNAHTTASDALWAGLPVLTLPGLGFAARVAASLLRAIGLPELIAESQADYERLALVLARDPARLGALKARLAANRAVMPLFDTAGFTRGLEAAYDAAHDRYVQGLGPGDIDI